MRCTRCDRIAVPQMLARAPDGRLVFGWCAACLEDQGCEPVGTEAAVLVLSAREPLPRRLRRLGRASRPRRSRPLAPSASRRLAAVGLAGLMAAWALILAFLGGLRLLGAGDARGRMLLFGGGLMALTSLIVWVGVLGRLTGAGVILKVVQVAATIVGFGTLAWGIFRNEPRNAPWIVGIALGAIGIAWTARAIAVRTTEAWRVRAAAKP